VKTFPKSTEQIQDIVAALLVAGTGVTLAYNDGAGTLTISSSVDLTGYATTAYVDDEVSANGVSLQAFASNASNLTTGTVSDARLSANVPRLNAANTFTTGQTIQGIINSDSTSGGLHIVNSGMRVVRNVASLLVENQSTGWPLDLSHGNGGTVNVVGAQGGIPTLGFSLTRNNNNPDVRIVRNATGPTAETRAAGGLRVCNADGSALAAVECSGVSNSAAGVSVGHATQGWTPIGPVKNAMQSHQGHWSLAWNGIAGSASAQMVVGGHLGFTAAFGAGGAVTTRLTQASSGVLAVLASTSTADSTTLGSMNLASLTASGVAKFSGYPTGLLPAAASNAGSITYDTTLAKHVGCNGSSWNALW